jgi:hypothetical protein
LSIYLVRRTEIFPVLLALFVVATILTVAQILTGNKTLALLFPWRVSSVLVPIGSSIILASIVSAVFRILNKSLLKIMRPLKAAILGLIIILGYSAVCNAITLLNAPKNGITAFTRFVASTFQPGNLYLIPPDMGSFRIAAGVPVFVDFKSNPYKDTEVVEWFDRAEIAKDFYASIGDTETVEWFNFRDEMPKDFYASIGDTELVEWFNRAEIAKDFYASSKDRTCGILKNMSEKYQITHVIVRSDSSIANCGILHELYRDPNFAIYEVKKH